MVTEISTKDRNKRICNLYFQGYTLSEIAKIYGITRERVRQLINKNCPEQNTNKRKHKVYVRSHLITYLNRIVKCMFCGESDKVKNMIRAGINKYYCQNCDDKGR